MKASHSPEHGSHGQPDQHAHSQNSDTGTHGHDQHGHADEHGHGTAASFTMNFPDFRPVGTFNPKEDTIPPRENNPRFAQVENVDSGKDTLGSILGWKNATMTHAKIQDVLLIGATGRDVEFIKMNQRVRQLLDVDEIFSNKKIAGLGTIKTYSSIHGPNAVGLIYEDLARRNDLAASIVDHEGRETHRLDLRNLVQLLAIKEFNKDCLGKYKMADEKIEELFFSGEKIEVEIIDTAGQKHIIDLKEKCPIDQLYDPNDPKGAVDFNLYTKKLLDYQLGLQGMVEHKEDKGANWMEHHAQNSGQAVSADIRVLDKIKSELAGQAVFETIRCNIPNGIHLAIQDGRSEVNKKDAAFLAKTNPHEITDYDEKTGMGVFVYYDLCNKHRSRIADYKIHGGGSSRIWGAAIGQQKDESAYITSETYEGETISVVHIGGENREGIIYSALHNTYDLSMREGRGFELTDEEADDKILTDIIAPWLSANSKDWNMCLAASVGSKVTFTSLEALQNSGADWAKRKKPFCLRIRCLDLKTGEIKPQNFYSLDKLIEYVKERIRRGHIPGVPTNFNLSSFEGISKEDAKTMEESALPKDEVEEEINKDKIETLSPEELQNYFVLLNLVFEDKTKKVLAKFKDEGVLAMIDPEGTPIYLGDYLKQALLKLPSKAETLLQQISQGEKDRQKAAEIIVANLRKFSNRLQGELFNKANKGERTKKTVEKK